MSQQLEFTPEELAAIRAEYCKGATDTQFELFISECKARNARPGPHLVFQLRNSQEWDPVVGAKVYVKKPYWITTIAFLRLVAQRTGEYLGQGAEEYVYLDTAGAPSLKSEIPLPHEDQKMRPLPREPWVARARVYRKGFTEPMVGLARFEAYAGTTKDGNLTEMWSKRGPEQLYKCAEALALRKAFPEELGGFLIAEELKDLEEDEKPRGITPASVVPLPPPVPAVNQVPATPTDSPRPNEKVTVHPVVEVSVPKDTPEVNPETVVKATAKEVVLTAVPDLKPASELPPPVKKRGGRPKKASPDNGRDIATEGGITDADLENIGKPIPEFDEEANKREAEEFVDTVANMTTEEATEKGLPDPPEYSKIPDGEQKNAFIARTRALPEPGADIKTIGDYMLLHANKVGQPSKNLTVRDWTEALTLLEEAKKAGTLKELLTEAKNVPLPEF